jgi:hypothetical protein
MDPNHENIWQVVATWMYNKNTMQKLYCDSNKNKLVQHVTKTSKLQDGQGKPNLKPT